MALIPNISFCTRDNCKILKLSDITGTYSATNTGGWGAPNSALADVTEAIISVLLPDETLAVEFDVVATVTAATIIDGEFILDQLTMEDFGLDSDTKFPDGIYEITYTITEGGTEYTKSIKTFSVCQVSCCIEKMKTKFQEKLECDCGWEVFFMNYLKAKALLDGAKRAFGCGNDTKAENILESIEKLCNASNCNC